MEGVGVDQVVEWGAHGRREVVVQVLLEVGVVGYVGRDELVLQVELGECEQHGQLGRGEPQTGCVPFLQTLRVRKTFERAVEQASLLEPFHLAGVDADETRRFDGRDLQRVRLRFVVGEHELRDVVGHRREERISIRIGEPA